MEKLWPSAFLHIGPWAYLGKIIYGPAGPHHWSHQHFYLIFLFYCGLQSTKRRECFSFSCFFLGKVFFFFNFLNNSIFKKLKKKVVPNWYLIRADYHDLREWTSEGSACITNMIWLAWKNGRGIHRYSKRNIYWV